ncbi:uncharacterized protein LOC124887878 [Capsicum annuum]|uniref:uncharacterized protein LOC124887878 n=1 Tax=Capsicum annuum TaxID=4072 RepID=UPI001FB09593|nr:uncharacterized protein LOC124887878 [Capsicum annuum]
MSSTNQDEDDAIIGVAVTSALATGFAIIVNRVYSSMLPHCASSSFEALSNPYKITGWNRPIGDNEQPSEGSAHDSRILNDALERPHGLQIPQEYAITYKSKVIVLPQNKKDLFNLCHASLRSSVERVFAILKRRFRVIDNKAFWDFKTQVNVVLASYILHNHIVDLDPNDMIIQEVDIEAVIQPQNVQISQNSQGIQSYQTQRERREEVRQLSSKRDAIAHAMFINYDRWRNEGL